MFNIKNIIIFFILFFALSLITKISDISDEKDISNIVMLPTLEQEILTVNTKKVGDEYFVRFYVKYREFRDDIHLFSIFLHDRELKYFLSYPNELYLNDAGKINIISKNFIPNHENKVRLLFGPLKNVCLYHIEFDLKECETFTGKDIAKLEVYKNLKLQISNIQVLDYLYNKNLLYFICLFFVLSTLLFVVKHLSLKWSVPIAGSLGIIGLSVSVRKLIMNSNWYDFYRQNFLKDLNNWALEISDGNKPIDNLSYLVTLFVLLLFFMAIQYKNSKGGDSYARKHYPKLERILQYFLFVIFSFLIIVLPGKFETSSISDFLVIPIILVVYELLRMSGKNTKLSSKFLNFCPKLGKEYILSVKVKQFAYIGGAILCFVIALSFLLGVYKNLSLLKNKTFFNEFWGLPNNYVSEELNRQVEHFPYQNIYLQPEKVIADHLFTGLSRKKLSYINRSFENCELMDEGNQLICNTPVSNRLLKKIFSEMNFSEQEKELVKAYVTKLNRKNELDLSRKFKSSFEDGYSRKLNLGFFFHHHSHIFNPIINANATGDEKYSVSQYGFLLVEFLRSYLNNVSGLSIEAYYDLINSFFGIYLLMGILFGALILSLYRELYFIPLLMYLGGYFIIKLGYIPIDLAPGFNPVRHFFDIFVFALFALYTKTDKFRFLISASVFIGLSILWSKEFGVFLFLALMGTILFMTVEKKKISLKEFVVLVIPIASYLLIPNPIYFSPSNYYFWGVGLPELLTANYITIFLILLWMLCVIFLNFSNKNLKFLIFNFIYVALCMSYYVYNSSQNHLYTVLLCSWIPIIVFIVFTKKAIMDEFSINGKVLNMFMLIGLMSLNYFDFKEANALFEKDIPKKHVNIESYTKDYKGFGYFDFETNLDFEKLEKDTKLIKEVEKRSGGRGLYYISRFDIFWPIVTGVYNRLPLISLYTNLVMDHDNDIILEKIIAASPSYIVVDRDINSPLVLQIDNDIKGTGIRAGAIKKLRELINSIYQSYEKIDEGDFISILRKK